MVRARNLLSAHRTLIFQAKLNAHGPATLTTKTETPPPPARRRRSPEAAKAEAVATARRLLLEGGPNAVTLKAVAHDLGMTHANIIHHFGSAAGLQSALMGAMVRDLIGALMEAVAHLRSDEAAPRQLIDIVFDAADKGGAGHLAAWIALSHDLNHLEPVREALSELVQAIEERFAGEPDVHRRVTSAVLLVTVCAFGDAVVGGPLQDMLGREPDSMRQIAASLLPTLF